MSSYHDGYSRQRARRHAGRALRLQPFSATVLGLNESIALRNLLHIVTKRGKLTSNIVCRHSCFDANEAGWQVRKPRCDASARDLLSQHRGARRIETDHMKCALA